MLVIFNCLAQAGCLALTMAPLTEAHYYARMKAHGIGITYCQWIVPGTVIE